MAQKNLTSEEYIERGKQGEASWWQGGVDMVKNAVFGNRRFMQLVSTVALLGAFASVGQSQARAGGVSGVYGRGAVGWNIVKDGLDFFLHRGDAVPESMKMALVDASAQKDKEITRADKSIDEYNKMRPQAGVSDRQEAARIEKSLGVKIDPNLSGKDRDDVVETLALERVKKENAAFAHLHPLTKERMLKTARMQIMEENKGSAQADIVRLGQLEGQYGLANNQEKIKTLMRLAPSEAAEYFELLGRQAARDMEYHSINKQPTLQMQAQKEMRACNGIAKQIRNVEEAANKQARAELNIAKKLDQLGLANDARYAKFLGNVSLGVGVWTSQSNGDIHYNAGAHVGTDLGKIYNLFKNNKEMSETDKWENTYTVAKAANVWTAIGTIYAGMPKESWMDQNDLIPGGTTRNAVTFANDKVGEAIEDKNSEQLKVREVYQFLVKTAFNNEYTEKALKILNQVKLEAGAAARKDMIIDIVGGAIKVGGDIFIEKRKYTNVEFGQQKLFDLDKEASLIASLDKASGKGGKGGKGGPVKGGGMSIA